MIELDRRDDVALLTLAHGKANAFDAELCEALIARFDECANSWCRAVVVTGRGPIFSAGVDLVRVVDEGAPYVRRFLPLLSDAFEKIFAFEKPVVAAVNGHAIAGGCILACAADRRLMARGTARIGVPELLVGVAFPPVPLEIMRFAVTPQALTDLTLNGSTHVADAALVAGLVDGVVDSDRLTDASLAAAAAMAMRPAAAFALTKRQLRAPAIDRMIGGRRALDRTVEDLWCSAETLAAIRGYVERTLRKPSGERG